MEQMDMLFDPVFQEDQYNNEVNQTNQIVNSFNKLDMTSSYASSTAILWNTGIPCTDTESSSKGNDKYVLKYCEWKGTQVPCDAIFSPFPTDQGICCTFNMKAADKLFSGETYPQLIKNFQNVEKSPKIKTTIDHLTTEPGKSKGLLVVLDSHSDSLSASSLDIETQGFIGLITQGGNFPQINLGGFGIKPGHKNTVALLATNVSADNIQDVDPEFRNCYFEWESSSLKIYKNYTQSNCIIECNFFYAQKQLEKQFPPCSPWYFPTPEDAPNICDPWQAVQMSEIMANVPVNTCNYCLADCVSTILKNRISTAPLRKCQLNSLGSNSFCNKNDKLLLSSEFLSNLVSTEYLKRFSTQPYFIRKLFISSERKFGTSLLYGDVFESTNKPYNANDKDIAIVQIFFRLGYTTKIQRSQFMNWIGYFSNVGGIYGLVLGMGLISIVEIFWLAIQYLEQFNLKQRLQRTKNKIVSLVQDVKEYLTPSQEEQLEQISLKQRLQRIKNKVVSFVKDIKST